MASPAAETKNTVITDMKLTDDQLSFLDYCEKKFGNRYTDEDEDYKSTVERGIETPPIMDLWCQPKRPNNFRGKFHNQQNNSRGGNSSYRDNRNLNKYGVGGRNDRYGARNVHRDNGGGGRLPRSCVSKWDPY